MTPLSAAVGDRPVGRTSPTVTVPLVAAKPTLLTLIVYVPLGSPWAKLPAWLLVSVRSGAGAMVVGSLALLFAVLISTLPATVAMLARLAAALPATATVIVSAG